MGATATTSAVDVYMGCLSVSSSGMPRRLGVDLCSSFGVTSVVDILT
jgi:hypothetical protein